VSKYICPDCEPERLEIKQLRAELKYEKNRMRRLLGIIAKHNSRMRMLLPSKI
jgi:hypothetical protein